MCDCPDFLVPILCALVGLLVGFIVGLTEGKRRCGEYR